MKIIVILLFAYAMLCWVSDRIIKQREQHSPADEDEDDEILIDYDFYQIQQQLIQIQKTVERVKSIEDLITDIRDLQGNKVNKGSISYKKLKLLETAKHYLIEERRIGNSSPT